MKYVFPFVLSILTDRYFITIAWFKAWYDVHIQADCFKLFVRDINIFFWRFTKPQLAVHYNFRLYLKSPPTFIIYKFYFFLFQFVVLFFVTAASAGSLQNAYLPPNSATSAGGSGLFAPSLRLAPLPALALPPTTLYAVPNSHSASAPPVPILRLNNENNGDGSYRYE